MTTPNMHSATAQMVTHGGAGCGRPSAAVFERRLRLVAKLFDGKDYLPLGDYAELRAILHGARDESPRRGALRAITLRRKEPKR